MCTHHCLLQWFSSVSFERKMRRKEVPSGGGRRAWPDVSCVSFKMTGQTPSAPCIEVRPLGLGSASVPGHLPGRPLCKPR